MRSLQLFLFLFTCIFPAAAMSQTATFAVHDQWDFEALSTKDTEDGNAIYRELVSSSWHISFLANGKMCTQGRGGPASKWTWRVLSKDDENLLPIEIVDAQRRRRTITVRFINRDVIAISGLIKNCDVTYRRSKN